MFGTKDFADELISAGFDFFTGVPCSIIGGLITELTNREDVVYIPAVREDVAVGVAGGVYMAGNVPVVLMQNSGLGECLNALSSLSIIYEIPCLLIITWRGFEGKDAPEHIVMGKACDRLLDSIGIVHRTLSRDNVKGLITEAFNHISEKKTPIALFLKKGVID